MGWEERKKKEEGNDNGIVTNSTIIKIMPRLQSLTILNCDKLKSLPDYLLTAPLLKKLEIYRSKLLQKHYQRGNKKNWHKISHISNIELGGVYVQRDGEAQFDSKVTLPSFLFFLYFIFSFQIYQSNINI